MVGGGRGMRESEGGGSSLDPRGGGAPTVGSAAGERAATVVAQIHVPMIGTSPPCAVGASKCAGRGRGTLPQWRQRGRAPPRQESEGGEGCHALEEVYRLRAARGEEGGPRGEGGAHGDSSELMWAHGLGLI